MKKMHDFTIWDGGKFFNNAGFGFAFKLEGADKVFADTRIYPHQ